MQSRGEVEFVVRDGSLKRFVEKYDCPFGVILSRNNFGASGRLRTMPLYAAFYMEDVSVV